MTAEVSWRILFSSFRYAHSYCFTYRRPSKTDDYFAQQVGISEVRAELLLEEKVQSIEKLQAENHKVCMIGDGVNDAPALKTADVSVAMGSMGSDIAVDAAEVALMRKTRISH